MFRVPTELKYINNYTIIETKRQYNTTQQIDKHHGDGDRSVGGRDRLWTCLNSFHNRPLPPSPFRVGAGSVALVGLRVLPPHEANERAGLTARVDARLENLGRDVAPTSLNAPVFWLRISGREVYGEGNSRLVDGIWIGVLAGRSGLAERTERRRMVLVVVGTLVGTVLVGWAGWRGAFVGSRRYLARLKGYN